MSKIGRLPITIPTGVEVKVEGSQVTVKGAKGQLVRSFHPDISISLTGNTLVVTRPSDSRLHRSLHGLTRSLLANMITGVSQGFEKSLELVGIGFRAQMVDGKLALRLGYSHPMEIAPVPGVSFVVESPTMIKVQGIDNELVGEVANRICRTHLPDHYKGKGLRYRGQLIRLKPGKAGKGAAKQKV